MSNFWNQCLFENAPLEIQDGDRGVNYPNQTELTAEGYCLFLNAGNVTTNGFNFSELTFINKEKDTILRKGKLVRGDIVLTTRGTVGNVAFYDETIPFDNMRINSGMVILRVNPNELLPRYLYLLLRSQIFKNQVTSLTTGSAQPQLPIRDMKKIHIPLPPLPEQKAIARILGSLDDKIELNRRMNATLEAIAQTLFRAWFVDFEPVKAKAAGLVPVGMDAETAALFPSEFEESELGLIPKGWEIEELDKVANFLNGLALQKFPPVGDDTDLPIIKIAQLRKGNTNANEKANCKIGSPYVIKDGDVLFSWSGSLEVAVWSGGVGALNQHLFKVTSDKFPKWFYYLWTLYHLPHFREIAADKATTMGHIQRRHLTEAKVLVPKEELLEHMSKIMTPLLARIENNLRQSQTLAQIRDSLLPRLISGQLRVPDAEAFVAEVNA